MALMGAAGAGFYLASGWLGRQFAPDKPEVAQTAAMLMRIVAFGQAPQALSMVLSGALRGSGDTRGPMVISLVGFLVVRIPLAYWLAWDRIDLHIGPLSASLVGCGLGVRGAWLAMLIDMLLRSLLFAGRFMQGHWKRIDV
jgi:Na+-driven multidrug efflux pump